MKVMNTKERKKKRRYEKKKGRDAMMLERVEELEKYLSETEGEKHR